MGLETIPGPRGWPVLGMAPAFQSDPFAYAAEVSRHGDLVRVPFPGQPLVYVLAPELIEQVLVRDAKSYCKGRFFSRVGIVFGEGILLAEDEAWKRQRRRMAPAFTHKAVQALAQCVGPMAVDLAHDWAVEGPESRDIHADMTAVTVEVALRTLFSTGLSPDELDQVRAAVRDISAHFARTAEVLLPLPLWVPTPANRRFQKARACLDGVVARVLGERREAEHLGTDLLGRLLAASADAGDPLTEAQLQDEVRTLILAGHETTAVALTVTLWHLARHPEVQSWVHEEVDAVAGPVAVDQPLPRVEAVLDESMRLIPPAPAFPRETRTEVELGGHTLPAGTTMMIAPFVTQRRDAWFDEPEVWRPTRWTPELRDALPRFAYFPFGGGPRICIGMHLARVEARVVVAELLRRFSLAPANDSDALPLWPSITMRPTGPVPVVFTRR